MLCTVMQKDTDRARDWRILAASPASCPPNTACPELLIPGDYAGKMRAWDNQEQVVFMQS